MFWISILAIPAILIVMILFVIQRGKQIGELARNGIPATAIVTRRFRTNPGGAGSKGRRIGFRYQGPDGRDYERFASLSIGRYADVKEGDPLPIYLLPDDPGISAPAWLVEESRKALAKRGR